MSEVEKVKVLYIAGSGRSGSTIFQNVIGQADGFYPIGELNYVWTQGFFYNKLCGCGKPFRECEVWAEIARRASINEESVDYQEMMRHHGNLRNHHLPLMAVPALRRKKLAERREYTAVTERFYHAIQAVSGCKVIVDASKHPGYGFTVGMIPSIELYVVQLLRDPRAVGYSWMKKKVFEPTGNSKPDYMDQYSPLKSALQWNARNLLSELALRRLAKGYFILRYEDFIVDPAGTVQRVFDLVGEPQTARSFINGNQVEIQPTHTIYGNLSRFQTGTVTLRSDDAWKSHLKRSDKLIVTAITLPLLLRYRYSPLV